MITWDEDKRQRNLRVHGIDFALLSGIFDWPMFTVEDTREFYGEQRLQSLAWYDGRVVFVVWTERDDGVRLISCRYGDKNETKYYFKNTNN